MGSDPILLAEMVQFWLDYDAAATDAGRAELLRRWHLTHGGRYARAGDWPEFKAGDVIPGLHPVRV